MSREHKYMIGREIDGGDYYWTSCGWSLRRECGSLYDLGTAKSIIGQMQADEKWAYLV